MACGYCENKSCSHCEGGYYDLRGRWVRCTCRKCGGGKK